MQFTQIAVHECIFYGPYGYTVGNVNSTESPELCTRRVQECSKNLCENKRYVKGAVGHC